MTFAIISLGLVYIAIFGIISFAKYIDDPFEEPHGIINFICSMLVIIIIGLLMNERIRILLGLEKLIKG